MKCRPGDLAVIINCTAVKNIGELVRVLGPSAWPGVDWVIHCDTPLERVFGPPMQWACAADRNLQPIRDQPGDDQTIEWAGKPAETPGDLIREVTTCG